MGGNRKPAVKLAVHDSSRTLLRHRDSRRRACCATAGSVDGEAGAALLKKRMASCYDSSPVHFPTWLTSADASGEASKEEYVTLLKTEDIKVENIDFGESCSSQQASSDALCAGTPSRRSQKDPDMDIFYHCSECGGEEDAAAESSAADGGTETGAALIKKTMTSYIESSPSPSAQLSVSTDASGEAPSEEYGALLKSEEIKVETLEFRESCSSQPTSSGSPKNNSSHRRAQRSTGKERKYHCSECALILHLLHSKHDSKPKT
ncbi:hypothetical protein SRHO_G00082160 [Serrasalmus rhombeus]